MREKLLDLMKNEGLKPSQLAEMLEINPAGISHILAGRNKPGFDLLQKILRRFPQINPDWLLLDSTKMYREESDSAPASSHLHKNAPMPNTGSIVSSNLFERGTARQPTAASEQSSSSGAQSFRNTIAGISATTGKEESPHGQILTTPEVERIVIIYKDRTFESFIPKIDNL